MCTLFSESLKMKFAVRLFFVLPLLIALLNVANAANGAEANSAKKVYVFGSSWNLGASIPEKELGLAPKEAPINSAEEPKKSSRNSVSAFAVNSGFSSRGNAVRKANATRMELRVPGSP